MAEPVKALDDLLQRPKEDQAVAVVLDDRFAPNAAGGYAPKRGGGHRSVASFRQRIQSGPLSRSLLCFCAAFTRDDGAKRVPLSVAALAVGRDAPVGVSRTNSI